MGGFDYRIGQEAVQYPLAWLSPLKLAKVEGRLEGIITYKAEMKLLALNEKYEESGKEEAWGRMERDIVSICRGLLAEPNVFHVEGLKAEPLEFTLTNQGELSMNAEFNVKMNFLCK